MNGFRVNGVRKKHLLEELNRIGNSKIAKGVNVKNFFNEVIKVPAKEVPNKFTTKQLTGLIAQLKEL